MFRIRGINLIVFLVALIALIVPVIVLERSVLSQTSGQVVFPSDNAFIDITVARNLAYYKVWGISKFAFQPVASSLLYPLVLAPAFFVAGEYLLLPVVVNGLLAAVLLFVIQQAMIRRGLKPAVQLAVLLATIALAPLPLLVVSGMGYLLPLLACFLFMDGLAVALDAGPARLPVRVYVYGLLMVASAYETVVLLAFACVLLLLRKRKREALRLGLLSLLPMILFGSISLVKGNAFIPSSLCPRLYPLFAKILAGLAVFQAGVLIRQWYRISLRQGSVSLYRVSLGLLCLLALPFLARNIAVLSHFTRDSSRIYKEEFRLAAFIHRYYKMASVGVNDIGAVAWFSDGKKLDFTGLTSADVAQKKKNHDWSPQWADSLSRKNYVSTFMVSDPWFRPEAFPDWDRVASWKFPDSPDRAGRTLSFFVRNQRDTVRLLRFLRDYQKGLSKDIDVRYY